MNPYTLTLLRHGEIDHQGRLIGHLDLPLTELGARQMASSWRRINGLAPVTALATSPLLRCREFAVRQALTSAVLLKVDERFSEMDFGDWDGSDLERLGQTHPSWRAQLADGSLNPPGGESFDEFRTRTLSGFSEWISGARGSHRVLVTHGGVITALLAELLGITFSSAQLMTVQRGGFAQLSMLEGHPAYLMHLEAPCAD
ncbi:histidine phosphatase family protein [Paludibacterium yongneupense]|uniref:histidine phosphatase family protein n=1 Tax=Paludibacterium yongneupense TaxID=400061 RepID=UPI0004035186|nr:histidine phosphatase family protein [Paludibacterium yongneupense]